jgi:hypothetical protein
MPKPTLSQRISFKTWLRKYRTKFDNTTIPEYWIDSMLSEKASGISTTDNVRVIPFNNFGTEDVSTDVSNDTLFYLPALSNDTVTLSVGSSSYTFRFVGEDGGITYDGTTYNLNDTIPINNNKVLTIKGLGGGLLQSSNAPTYTVGVSTTSVDEGSSVDFTIDTTDVSNGTTLYYNTASSMGASDFSDNSLTGSFTIVGTGATTGVATVTRTIANDFATEGTESFALTIRTGSTSGPVVATSASVSVNDVVPTVSISESTTTVDEGSSVTFTVTATGFASGTTLYWTTYQESGTITASDFTDSATEGSFSISSGTGTVVRSIASDRLTESIAESFKLEIRRDSTSGTIVATSEIITINDRSRNIGAYANGLTFGPVQVNRDNGSTSLASDWYTICDIDTLPEGSSIALFIDTSGSMTQATIQASYDLLVEKLNAKNITITSVTNPNEDWITPFLVDLP